MMKVIGLTGGIATGKSTVTNILLARGVPVCDTDKIARKVVEKGTPALQALATAFGTEILTSEKTLNRQVLATIIFQDEQKRHLVNSIVHPYVFEAILNWKKEQTASVVFIDMPLLYEVGYDTQVDSVLVVYIPKEKQLERLMKRNGYTLEEASIRIEAQMPIEEKRVCADDVIDNSGTIEETEKQVIAYLEKQKM
ncbi:dephospho-CoA kinase [Carnobacteriaceae bacterium zg-84]|nr:dephospho-CoA kinase [Granulicatella sp. zg-84]QMI86683.1 dephospho-CoA kinase [Carnobacteriaceae bacterium zg-84]